MTEGIEAATSAALTLALDAASLRQQAIAATIANANVNGYVPQRVSFEAQLEDARQSMAHIGRLDPVSLGQVQPRLEPAVGRFGSSSLVQLDMEAAEMARNAVHYQALVKGLSRHFSILSMAAGDGRK